MKKFSYKLLMKILNSSLFQVFLRKFTNSNFSSKFISKYINKFDINTQELEKDPKDYKSLNDFFTRHIDMSFRPMAMEKNLLISPSDGLLSHQGLISEEATLEIKNKPYSIYELLDSEDIDKLKGGLYSLIYLSPANYHRFHAITDCKLINQYARGDKSEPVNDIGLKFGEGTIVKNYRIVQELEDKEGNNFFMIFIGAVNVNSIIIHDKLRYSKGEEVGYFEFGSSIMVLFPKGMVKNLKNPDTKVQVGQALYEFK